MTQRTYGPQCSGSIAVDISNMKDGDYAGLASSISSINQRIGTMDDALQQTMVDVQINNESNILTGYKTDGSQFQRRVAVMATESDIDDLTDGYVQV